jgi:HNH endonuclease/NUMOD4 motif
MNVCAIMATEEIWKPIVGFEDYEVSSEGRIRSLKPNHHMKVIKSWSRRNSYKYVFLWKDGKPKAKDVHRLVATHFINNLDNKREVNHINGDKFDNRAENLEWVTPSENQQHSIALGLRKDRGEQSVNSRLKKEQVSEIRKLYSDSGITYRELSRIFGVHRDYIGLIINRKRWNHI